MHTECPEIRSTSLRHVSIYKARSDKIWDGGGQTDTPDRMTPTLQPYVCVCAAIV